MEHPEKAPTRHSELHDPKLPIIHGEMKEQHCTTGHIPQSSVQ